MPNEVNPISHSFAIVYAVHFKGFTRKPALQCSKKFIIHHYNNMISISQCFHYKHYHMFSACLIRGYLLRLFFLDFPLKLLNRPP